MVEVFASWGARIEASDNNYQVQVRAPESVMQWLLQQAMNNNSTGFAVPAPVASPGPPAPLVFRGFDQAESQRIAAAVVARHGLPRVWVTWGWTEQYRRSLAAELVEVFATWGAKVEAYDNNYQLQVRAPEPVMQWLVQQAMNGSTGFAGPG